MPVTLENKAHTPEVPTRNTDFELLALLASIPPDPVKPAVGRRSNGPAYTPQEVEGFYERVRARTSWATINTVLNSLTPPHGEKRPGALAQKVHAAAAAHGIPQLKKPHTRKPKPPAQEAAPEAA